MVLRTVLVDDNRPFLVLARRLLSDCSQITIIGEASNGHDAVRLAETLHPDLMIIDLAMPGMGGLQATRLIKAQDTPPIIVIASHYDDPAHREFVAQVGAEGFVNKQFYETEVIEFVQRLPRESNNV